MAAAALAMLQSMLWLEKIPAFFVLSPGKFISIDFLSVHRQQRKASASHSRMGWMDGWDETLRICGRGALTLPEVTGI